MPENSGVERLRKYRVELLYVSISRLRETYTVAVYSWSIANNFVIVVYCRCLEILSQIAFSSVANYFEFIEKSNLV